MKLRDCLEGLSDEKIISIGNNLQLFVSNNNRIWNIDKIVGFLTTKDGVGSGFGWVLQQLHNDTMQNFINFIMLNKLIPLKSIEELEKYSFYIHDIVPEEFQNAIFTWKRNDLVKQLPQKKRKTIHSLFLKFVLLLIYFSKEQSIKIKQTKNNKSLKNIKKKMFLAFDDNKLILELLTHALNTKLIIEHDDKYQINFNELELFLQEASHLTLGLFYRRKLKKDHQIILRILSQFQCQEEEWVNQIIFDNYYYCLQNLVDLGLVEITTDKQETYVRLSNEGWLILKNRYPNNWHQKLIMISADYEIFYPFNYDPLLLLELSSYCSLKECEHLIVLEIDQTDYRSISEDRKLFYEILKNHSNGIPDVIKYDFENLTN